MAMILGSATVDNNGNVTKSGVVGRCYDEIFASTSASIPGGFPSGATGTTFKRAIASQATNMGTALYKVLTIDAQVKIGTSVSGLQRMPASTAEDTDTKAPSLDKFLPIV
jgi:hypothetical protein